MLASSRPRTLAMALVQSPVQRQSSQSSSPAASERILALGSRSQKPVEPLAPVDLDDAEEHEEKLSSALVTVRESLVELMKECPLDPTKRNPEQIKQILALQNALAQIESHQAKLKEDMIYARSERRKKQAEQRKAAMVVHKPKAPPMVRMEELRALNQTRLDPDDVKLRTEQAQKPKGIIPSGGFTGFRVAPDLRRMDFTDDDPNDPDKVESWRTPVGRK